MGYNKKKILLKKKVIFIFWKELKIVKKLLEKIIT